MNLNKDTKYKFNILLVEVAEYYNLGDRVNKANSMYSIAAEDLGCKKSEMVSTDILFNTITDNYPYLVPFIKLFKANVFKNIGNYQDYVNRETFEEINEIVKKIRKNKLIIENARRAVTDSK